MTIPHTTAATITVAEPVRMSVMMDRVDQIRKLGSRSR